jgi:plastocyanin
VVPNSGALALTALLLLSTASAPGAAQRPAPLSHTVVIENVQFSPQELTVHRGETIVWVNKDLFPHTVTADAKAFDSGSIAASASWRYVAAKPGTYPYGCTFHPTMKGKIVVE